MNSKKLNVVEIFMHIATLMFLFLKDMFYCHIEKPNEANQRVTNSFFDLRAGEFLLIAFLMTVIFSLFFCVLWALIKSKRQFNFIHILLPIVATLMFIFIGFLYTAGAYATLAEELTTVLSNGTSRYSLGPVFYIELIVLISMCIISIIKRKKYSEYDYIAQVEVDNKSTIQNIESIKKYKELLDLGIITQEEFEEKKKEFLFK